MNTPHPEVTALRIVCMGDSNTYGYDPRGYWGGRYDPETRWPDLLALRTGWDVINDGVNGRCIPRPTVCDIPRADCIAVMLGTNDLLQGASAREAAVRMEAFLTRLLPEHRQILLICPPPLKRGAWVPGDEPVAESLRLGEEYLALGARLNIPVADTRDWNIALAYDGVHFTEAGHHRFAHHLRRELEQFCPANTNYNG